MIRRRKIQVKPNQGLSKPKNEVEEEKPKKSKIEELSSIEENNNLNKIKEKTTIENVQEIDKNQQNINYEANNNVFTSTSSLESVFITASNEYVQLNQVVSTNSITSLPNMENNSSNNMFENVINEKKTNKIHLPPLLSSSTTSQQRNNNYLSGTVGSQKCDKNEANINEKRLKEKPKEKLCDTKKFTMADLIKWRPRTENTFRKKWSTKRKNDEEEKATILSKTDESDDLSTAYSISPKKGILEDEDDKQTSGPRVRINEQGEMVVDEDSLIVMQNPENTELETVINDDIGPKKLTSMSFRKRSRGSIWGVLETDLFYEVLAATGTDFGLMHEFIPNRTRLELKQKFNREHRTNPKRMDEALRNPVLLDGRLHQRVERFHTEMAK